MPTTSRSLLPRLGAARLVPMMVCLVTAVATGWSGATEAGVAARATAPPAAVVAPPSTPSPASAPPATVAEPAAVGGGFSISPVVARAGTPRPPQTAMAAYRRAASVMGLADPTCHLDWSVIAAVGGVSSDHGRVDGRHLDAKRRVRPALFGAVRVRPHPVPDSDAGVLDGTDAADRGAGPMLFWPSSWTSIGVDADGDGLRDPQDLDDASLAAGVLLCGGTRDLATPAGLARGLDDFHRSQGFVSAVVRLAAAYAATDAALPASGPLGFGEVLAVAGGGIVPLGPTAAGPGSDTGSGDGPTVANEPAHTVGTPSATPHPTPHPTPHSDPTQSNPTHGPSATPTHTPGASPSTTPTRGPTPTPTSTPHPSPTASAPTTAVPSPTCSPSPSPIPTAVPDPPTACSPTTSASASPTTSTSASPPPSPTVTSSGP